MFELYDKAKETFGEKTQFIVALEELSELQKEITKYLRGKGNKEHLTEEIADVRIMLSQITHFLNISNEDVLEIIEYKLNRLAKRINDKEEKK